MKVWVLEHRGPLLAGFYWTGQGLAFTNDPENALQLVRERDARALLNDNMLLNAHVVSKELPDRDEPGEQSAAAHRGDGGAVNIHSD